MTQSWKRIGNNTKRTGWSSGKMMNFNRAECQVTRLGTINNGIYAISQELIKWEQQRRRNIWVY